MTHEMLSAEELDEAQSMLRRDEAEWFGAASWPISFLHRLISQARLSLVDSRPVDEEWLRENGWESVGAMDGIAKDFGNFVLKTYTKTISEGFLIVQGNDTVQVTVTTRSQLLKLIAALGGPSHD